MNIRRTKKASWLEIVSLSLSAVPVIILTPLFALHWLPNSSVICWGSALVLLVTPVFGFAGAAIGMIAVAKRPSAMSLFGLLLGVAITLYWLYLWMGTAGFDGFAC